MVFGLVHLGGASPAGNFRTQGAGRGRGGCKTVEPAGVVPHKAAALVVDVARASFAGVRTTFLVAR